METPNGGSVGDLVISKTAVGGDGIFNFIVSGPNAYVSSQAITTVSGAGTVRISNVAAGAYTVTESEQTGWSQVSNNGQPVTVAVTAGGTATVGIVNRSDNAIGNLVINKSTAGGDGTFNFIVSGPSPSTQTITTLNGIGSVTIPRVGVGIYAITEVSQPGWVSASNGLTASVPGAGTASVTFFNRATVVVGTPPPSLTGVSPNVGAVGTVVSVTLTGTNFIPGATTVTIIPPLRVAPTILPAAQLDSGFKAQATASTTSLTVLLDLRDETPGVRSITVTTAGGTTGGVRFTLCDVCLSISPSSGVAGTNVGVTITGTNFVSTTSVQPAPGINVVPISVTPSTILNPLGNQVATLILDPGAQIGGHELSVTTNPPSSVTFFVTSAFAPTLTSVSPNCAA